MDAPRIDSDPLATEWAGYLDLRVGHVRLPVRGDEHQRHGVGNQFTRATMPLVDPTAPGQRHGKCLRQSLKP